MPLDTGDVIIGPDGIASGTGLAKLIYDALADEHDAFPHQLPAPNTPGAQESLAKLARAIAAPIAIAVNDGVEVTANPGQVLGNELDAGSPLVAHPLTPAELNAIVGSVVLLLTQYLGFGPAPGSVPVGDIRGDGPFAIVGNASVDLGSLGGAVAITAVGGAASLHGTTLDLEATAGAAAIEATAGIDMAPGANEAVRIASGLIRLIERAAGIALAPGQALFYAKNDTPNNPYFRDDTNADRKLLTGPLPLADMATIAEATILLRALGTGFGAPVAGTAAQLLAILLDGGLVPARAVPAGDDGRDGSDGVDGQPGRQGLPGAAGLMGARGSDGDDGRDGSDGVPGLQGLPGAAGTQGARGSDGDDGRDGSDGMPGPGLPVYLLGPGEAMGNAIDSGSAAAPRPLSGAQIAELIRRSTTLALTPSPGDLTITVNANTTIVTVTTTGDVRVQGIIGLSDGRELTIEHIRASGVGELRLQHQSGIGGGAVDFLLPNGIDLFVGNRVGIVVRQRASFLRLDANSAGAQLVLSERAAGQTLLAGQGQFYAKNDTPCNPYFRDDTNADRKILTAPAALSDIATIAQGTALGRAVLGGTGVPVALTGVQQGQNLRRGTYYVDSTTTGVVATFALAEDATQIVFTGSGTIQLEGATIINGKDINWTVDVAATVAVTFMNDGASTITQERFRTPTQRQITIRAGEGVTTSYFLNRHRFVSVSKRVDAQLTSVVRDDFDGQCDIAGVLTRSPWIAWDGPTIAQVDTAASGYHSLNHPGVLHMQSDAALVDECAIYRGPFDFANIATFGATVMIPVDGGNELLNCAMGFGIVADPTDMDLTTGGGIWTDNNLVIMHRSAGAGAGAWLIRRENAGAAASGSSGVTVVAGTWATFRLEQTAPGSGSWRCYVNGALFTTATFANTSGIAYLAIGMIRGAGAAGRNLLIDEVFVDTFELNRAAA